MNRALNYRDVVDRLAAEYVLGTLRGQARRRLERWRISTALVDERCLFWEEQLMSLLTRMRTLQPPSDAWERIRTRLRLPDHSPRRLNRVQTWAVAVALWNVEFYGRLQSLARLQVTAGQQARPPAGRDYEHWALPKEGNPVSLRVLPYQANAIRRPLSDGQRTALASAQQLAVSVEPVGGSPTGQPTGAVVYVVPLQAIRG